MPTDAKGKSYKKQGNLFGLALHEFKGGKLHHGSTGKKVTNRSVALAIAYSMQKKHNAKMIEKHGKRKWSQIATKRKLPSHISSMQDARILGDINKPTGPEMVMTGEFRNTRPFGSPEAQAERRFGGMGHDLDRQ